MKTKLIPIYNVVIDSGRHRGTLYILDDESYQTNLLTLRINSIKSSEVEGNVQLRKLCKQ